MLYVDLVLILLNLVCPAVYQLNLFTDNSLAIWNTSIYLSRYSVHPLSPCSHKGDKMSRDRQDKDSGYRNAVVVYRYRDRGENLVDNKTQKIAVKSRNNDMESSFARAAGEQAVYEAARGRPLAINKSNEGYVLHNRICAVDLTILGKSTYYCKYFCVAKNSKSRSTLCTLLIFSLDCPDHKKYYCRTCYKGNRACDYTRGCKDVYPI